MLDEPIFIGNLVVAPEKRKRNTENAFVRLISVFIDQDNIRIAGGIADRRIAVAFIQRKKTHRVAKFARTVNIDNVKLRRINIGNNFAARKTSPKRKARNFLHGLQKFRRHKGRVDTVCRKILGQAFYIPEKTKGKDMDRIPGNQLSQGNIGTARITFRNDMRKLRRRI